MAKVGHIEKSVLGKYMKFAVKCSSQGVFSVDLPSEFKGIVEFTNAYDTRSDLDKALTEMINKIESEQTTFYDKICYKFRMRNGVRDGRKMAEIEVDYLAVRTYKTGARHAYRKITRKTEEEIQNMATWVKAHEIGEIIAQKNGIVYYIGSGDDYHQNPKYDRKEIDFSIEGVEMFEALKLGIEKLGDRITLFLDSIQEKGIVLPGQNINLLEAGNIG